MILRGKLKENLVILMLIHLWSLHLCFERPRDLEHLYKLWKPLELVRGLRALSVDPLDVFRSLEAVKELDSEEALDVMHDLDVRPITIYDALDDLGVNPFDAYYALKAWLTDPLLHQPGDHYHRVNTSGDPTHPFLHVIYKKYNPSIIVSTGKSSEYKPFFMNSNDIEEELSKLEKEYKESLDEDKFRMDYFVKKAKEIHSAFDDPSKVFQDFFGQRHFDEWKTAFPDAFKNLKDIYQNPLGFSLRKEKKELNESTTHDKIYEHLNKGREFLNKERMRWSSDAHSDSFKKFNDPKRYDTLMDETHKENVTSADDNEAMKMRIYHTKVFYDKEKNLYIECKEIQEQVHSSTGVGRKVETKIRTFDPKSFEVYRKEHLNQQPLHTKMKSPQHTIPPPQHTTPPPQHTTPPPQPATQPPQHSPPPHAPQQQPPHASQQSHPYAQQHPPQHAPQQPPPYAPQHPPPHASQQTQSHTPQQPSPSASQQPQQQQPPYPQQQPYQQYYYPQQPYYPQPYYSPQTPPFQEYYPYPYQPYYYYHQPSQPHEQPNQPHQGHQHNEHQTSHQVTTTPHPKHR